MLDVIYHVGFRALNVQDLTKLFQHEGQTVEEI